MLIQENLIQKNKNLSSTKDFKRRKQKIEIKSFQQKKTFYPPIKNKTLTANKKMKHNTLTKIKYNLKRTTHMNKHHESGF